MRTVYTGKVVVMWEVALIWHPIEFLTIYWRALNSVAFSDRVLPHGHKTVVLSLLDNKPIRLY